MESTSQQRKRPLTEDEIEYILSGLNPIPPKRKDESINYRNEREKAEEEARLGLRIIDKKAIFSATDISGDKCLESLKYTLNEVLKTIQLVPAEIDNYKRSMIASFQKSRIHPGDMVGLAAGDAVGQLVTQTTLNTFHTAGSSKNISSGLGALRELVNVSEKRKYESCTIHFEDKYLSYDEVIEKGNNLVEINLSSLVDDYEIGVVEDFDNEKQNQFRKICATIRNIEIPETDTILRVYLNTNEMFKYKVSLEDVATAIERESLASVNGNRYQVIVVYSNLAQGILEIWPDIPIPEEEETKLSPSPSYVFLSTCMIREFDNIFIQGIPGIKRVYPRSTPVISLVKNEMREYPDSILKDEVERRTKEIELKSKKKQLSTEEKEQIASDLSRQWILLHNDIAVRISGMPIRRLKRLCEVSGLMILEDTKEGKRERTRVRIPEDMRGRTPMSIIKELIAQDVKDENDQEERNKRAGMKNFRRPPTEITNAANYWYADTDGSNLQELLLQSEIDPYHTTCNNVRTIMEMFGIEAARNFLMQEFYDMLTVDDSYLNPRHIILLIDFMTNKGYPYAVTYSGLSRQKIGPFAKSSFSQAAKTIGDSAVFGAVEKIQSTSTSIFVGKKALVGTGYMDVLVNQDMIDEFLKNESKKPLAADLSKAIKDIDDFNFSQPLAYNRNVPEKEIKRKEIKEKEEKEEQKRSERKPTLKVNAEPNPTIAPFNVPEYVVSALPGLPCPRNLERETITKIKPSTAELPSALSGIVKTTMQRAPVSPLNLSSFSQMFRK